MTLLLLSFRRLLAATLIALTATAHGQSPAVTRVTADYRPPDVVLTRADGARVHFLREIDDGRPVILNFIFASCSAVCPTMSRTFAAAQARLAGEEVHLISISMDPESDTPLRLRDYARRYGAGPDWQFYTGSLEESVTLQKAFLAWRGDKMNHGPLTFIRRAPGAPWVRLEGFATPDDIVREYRLTVAGR